jgi:hypothetical protein
MSKRARIAAMAREVKRLFPSGTFDRQPPEALSECARDLEQALRLRELAARGMSKRKFLAEAVRLEAKWEGSR